MPPEDGIILHRVEADATGGRQLHVRLRFVSMIPPMSGHAPPLDPLQRERRLRWTIAGVYTLLLYTLAWFVNPLWLALTRAMGTEAGGDFVNTAVPMLGLLVLAALLLRRRLPTWLSYLWLVAVAAGYGYVLTLHADFPVERIHLLQYSLVAFVYFAALRLDRPDRRAYLGAAIAVLVIGVTDEVIQEYLIPRRSGTMGDVLINWFSGGLGLAGLVAVRRGGFWDFLPRLRPSLRWMAGAIAPILLATFSAWRMYTGYFYPPINLLIITVDCARPDFWGIYGKQSDPPATEYLDHSAAAGAVFTSMFSQATWTSPGVASVLTGLYPPTHGVVTQERTVPAVVTTVLDAFKQHGYSVPRFSYLINAAPNFLNLGEFDEDVIDVTVTNEMTRIRQWLGENHRRPFALWYHWRYMHLPYYPPARHWLYPPAEIDPERMRRELAAGLNPRDEVAMPPLVRELITKEVIIPYFSQEALEEAAATGLPPRSDAPRAHDFPPETEAWLDALYTAQARHFDVNFEAIRYVLALHHKLKHTIIVITADHGEELLEHGYIGHASTAVHSRHYDEQLHIPLVILCPRLIKRGRRIDAMAQQVDILPTVMDMMGWPIPMEVQGRSLWPAMRGEKMDDVPVFAESVEGGYQSKLHQRTTFVRSVRTRDWKLIARMGPRGDEFELYDLAEDPGELRNLYAARPDVAKSMIDELSAWVSENARDRRALEKKEEIFQERQAALDPKNLSVPEILTPRHGDTIRFEEHSGGIGAEWTGNPHAAYIIEYDIGEGWHRLQGTYPVDEGTKHVFGPLPEDGWKPLYQWNPYKLRVRPRDLPDGWSEWITVNVAPLAKEGDVD